MVFWVCVFQVETLEQHILKSVLSTWWFNLYLPACFSFMPWNNMLNVGDSKHTTSWLRSIATTKNHPCVCCCLIIVFYVLKFSLLSELCVFCLCTRSSCAKHACISIRDLWNISVAIGILNQSEIFRAKECLEIDATCKSTQHKMRGWWFLRNHRTTHPPSLLLSDADISLRKRLFFVWAARQKKYNKKTID